MENNNQNTMENTTEKKETIFGKVTGFVQRHRKGVAITVLALLGGGAAAAIAANKKNKDEDDDISDVSYRDLENDEESNSANDSDEE